MIIEGKGFRELATGLGKVSPKLLKGIEPTFAAALKPIIDRAKKYPDQKPPANPKYLYKRGVGTYYEPKGTQYHNSERFGARIVSRVANQHGNLMRYIVSPASYSGYVRGTMEPGKLDPAGIHKGNWESWADILDAELPALVRRIDRGVADWIQQNNL